MSKSITHNGARATHPIAAMVLFGILAFGSFQLKTSGVVGDAAFVSLLTISGIFGFIVYFQERIKKASATGFELHEAVQEVKDAEDRIRILAHAVADLVEAGNKGAWKSEDYDHESFLNALSKVRNLEAEQDEPRNRH